MSLVSVRIIAIIQILLSLLTAGRGPSAVSETASAVIAEYEKRTTALLAETIRLLRSAGC